MERIVVYLIYELQASETAGCFDSSRENDAVKALESNAKNAIISQTDRSTYQNQRAKL